MTGVQTCALPIWLALVFTLAAFGVQLYVLKLSFTKGKDARSKFYGFPIARIGVMYLIVQIALSFLFMAIAKICAAWIAVIAFVLMLAVAAVGIIAADAMRDEVERQDAQLKTDVAAMRALQSRAAALASRCEDAELKADAQKLSDAFRYSDPMTNDATKETEHELAACMDELERAVLDNDTESARTFIKRTAAQLAERNRLCKLNK